MKIKDRIKKAFTDPLSVASAIGIVSRNYSRASRFQPLAQVVGITYKAIDKIGSNLSLYEPKVLKLNGDSFDNHPLYTLYNAPNPNVHSASDFIHLYAMIYLIYGETFWYLARGESSRKIKELYLLDPSKIELKVADGELIGYVLHKANGDNVPFMPDEIYHDKSPNPFNEWRGMSVLEKAAHYIDTEIATANFTLNYISNAASPSGIVSLPNMDTEAFKMFTNTWREQYEGPENAGKTGFIRGGEAKFQAVGSTLKDIDQQVTRGMAKDDVLMMLGVPKEILGLTNDTGFGRSTIEAFDYVFAKNTIEPLMRRLDRIYEYIGCDLMAQPIDVTHASPVPDDKEYHLNRLKDGTNLWLTINDAREIDGLEPITGGDVIIPKSPLAPTIGEPQKAAKQIVIRKKIEARKLTKAEAAKAEHETKEQFRKHLVEVNDIFSAKLKTEISSFAAAQEKLVISKISKSSKAYDDWLFNVKEDSVSMAALLLPIILVLMETQSEEVVNFITGEQFVITPELTREIEARITQISGVYNTDTIKALEKTLTQGQSQGESLVKLKKRVEDVFSKAKGYRAERIAATESLRASNLTAEQVYKQNGYAYKEWFVNPNACEFCRVYAGRVVEIGSNFADIGEVVTGVNGGQLSLDYSTVDTPPLHPNCRCSLIPVVSQ